jgi:NAD(P)-dependent dehydrogenase (short-subunit alcohol dehydrogenase family)
MGSLQDRVVFITGASSGIGEALAREYVRAGARVALLARRTDRLDALCTELNAGGSRRAAAFTADVTKDGEVEAAVARTLAEFGRIDVVVANAGGGLMGHFAKLSLPDFRGQVELNVFGVLRTLFASLEELKKSRGSIVIVSSVMAYLPLPAASAYNMSKAAVMALSESLRVDLSPLGISVTHVAPGFINTELRRVGADGKKNVDGVDPVPLWLQMPAPVAARKIIRATQRRRRELVLTAHGKAGVFLGRHFSGLTSAILAFGARRSRLGV